MHKKVLAWLASKYRAPVLSVNQVGGMDNFIYPGGSMVFNAYGSLCAQSPMFKEDVLVVDLDRLLQQDSAVAEKESPVMEEIWNALVLGVRDFVVKCGFSKAVLGLSGGIDSALVAAIAVEALGKENVLGVLMPSPYSSQGSLDDSARLARNLGIKTTVIHISSAMDTFDVMLKQNFTGLKPDTTEENIQARIRSVILMAFANKFNCMLLNTGNKSETAMGYCTLYGDSAGALAVIADLYKTEVYMLAGWLNESRGFEFIPVEILTKAPSAELKAKQRDSDSLPEYAVLDALLTAYLDEGNDEATLVERGFEAGMVKKVLQTLRHAEFKRRQTPPALRVSRHAFGHGGNIPIATSFK
jgi:NAD+ synthetase